MNVLPPSGFGASSDPEQVLTQKCPGPGVVVVKRVNGMEFAVNKMGRAWYGGN